MFNLTPACYLEQMICSKDKNKVLSIKISIPKWLIVKIHFCDSLAGFRKMIFFIRFYLKRFCEYFVTAVFWYRIPTATRPSAKKISWKKMITSSHYSLLFYLTKIGESGLSNSDENHALTKGKPNIRVGQNYFCVSN